MKKDQVLVKSAERVVYQISSDHNTYFVSIDSNGAIAYKSNATEETLNHSNNVSASFRRKSDKNSFTGRHSNKGEFENGKKHAKEVTFKHYVLERQLMALFSKKDLKEVEIF